MKRLKSLDLIFPSLLACLARAGCTFVVSAAVVLLTAFSCCAWALFCSLRCLLRLWFFDSALTSWAAGWAAALLTYWSAFFNAGFSSFFTESRLMSESDETEAAFLARLVGSFFSFWTFSVSSFAFLFSLSSFLPSETLSLFSSISLLDYPFEDFYLSSLLSLASTLSDCEDILIEELSWRLMAGGVDRTYLSFYFLVNLAGLS